MHEGTTGVGQALPLLRVTTHAGLFDAFAMQSPPPNGLSGEKSLLPDSDGHSGNADGEAVDLVEACSVANQ